MPQMFVTSEYLCLQITDTTENRKNIMLSKATRQNTERMVVNDLGY